MCVYIYIIHRVLDPIIMDLCEQGFCQRGPQGPFLSVGYLSVKYLHVNRLIKGANGHTYPNPSLPLGVFFRLGFSFRLLLEHGLCLK